MKEDDIIVADVLRVSDTMDPLLHELGRDFRYNADLIAASLGLHSDAVRLVVQTLTPIITNAGGHPAKIGLEMGLMLGARLARANADAERVA